MEFPRVQKEGDIVGRGTVSQFAQLTQELGVRALVGAEIQLLTNESGCKSGSCGLFQRMTEGGGLDVLLKSVGDGTGGEKEVTAMQRYEMDQDSAIAWVIHPVIFG